MFKLRYVFVLLLLVPFSSAFEFDELDNVKSYNEEFKVVTITNNFGLGDVIGQARLTSPLNVEVGLGYQKVAQFDIWAYSDYNDAIKQFTFTDMNKKEKINREFDLKMLSYEEVVVEDYYYIDCETPFSPCIRVENGSHIEQREVWTKVTPSDLKKNEMVTIGIFTETQQGDYVDWIPTIYGVEIEEWATWTADLNTGLVAYYNFDESSGDLIDLINGHDGTNHGATLGATGKIEDAWDFENGDNDYVAVSDNNDFDATTALSISMWFKPESIVNSGLLMKGTYGGTQGVYTIAMDANSVSTMYWRINGNSCNKASAGLSAGTWTHFVGTYDKTTMRIWLNGNNVANCSYTNNINTNTDDLTIGNYYGNTYSFDGLIDELGIWKDRTLSATEITQLYNGGDGITYELPKCTFSGYVLDEDGTGLVGANVTVWNQYDISEYYENTTITGGHWSLNITNSTKTYMAGAYYNNTLIGQLKPYISGTC